MANEMKVFEMTKQGKAVIAKQKEKTVMAVDSLAIYQDNFVAVRPDCLIVKKFFIPSELPYEFPWHQILSMNYTPQEQEDKQKVLGRGMDSDGRWWAVDLLRARPDRELRLYNIRIEASETDPAKCGFSVIRIEEFLKACRPLLSYHCGLSGSLSENY